MRSLFLPMPLPWASVCCEGAIHEGGAVLEYIFEAHAAAEELLRSTGAGSADVRSPYTVPTWSASMNPTPPRQNKSLEDVLFAARTRTAETSRWLVDLLLAGCESSAARRRTQASPSDRARTLGGVLAQQPLEAPGSSGSLRPFERLILKLNSAEVLRTALARHVRGGVGPAYVPVARRGATAGDAEGADLAAAGAGQLSAVVDGLLMELARDSAQRVLDQCGLGPKLAALQTASQQQHIKMSEVIGLEPLALGAAMRSFYSLTFRQGDSLLGAQAELISASATRRQAATLTARVVASTHRHIHELVRSRYETPEGILLHSPEEIDALLGLAT